jgi:carboxylesterase type B
MCPAVNTIPQLATTYQPIYDNVTRTVGCESSTDSLACLRTVSFQKLYNALVGLQFLPIVDGKFIPQYPSESIDAGQIADVAILIGSNTDECTATFFTPRGSLNTDDDVYTYLAGYGAGFDNNTIKTLMDLYPDDPALGCPFGTGVERFADQGFQFKRGAAISGDSKIHAGTRFLANYYAKNGIRPVYKYRFDQQPWNNQEVDVATVAPVSVTHYSEVSPPYINIFVCTLIDILIRDRFASYSTTRTPM